jgi:hypothetical protein
MKAFIKNNKFGLGLLLASILILFTRFYYLSVLVVVYGFAVILLNLCDDYDSYESCSPYIELNEDFINFTQHTSPYPDLPKSPMACEEESDYVINIYNIIPSYYDLMIHKHTPKHYKVD